jgi:hypothetical protein
MKYKKQNLISRTLTISFLLAIVSLIASCDKGFEEMNKNPNVYTEPVIGNLFTMSEVRTAGVGTADRNRVSIKVFCRHQSIYGGAWYQLVR